MTRGQYLELVHSHVGPRDWAQVTRLVSQCPVPLATEPFHWSLIFDTINYLMSKNHKTFSTSGLHLAILPPKSQCQRTSTLKKKSPGIGWLEWPLSCEIPSWRQTMHLTIFQMNFLNVLCNDGSVGVSPWVVITWYFSSFSHLPSQGTIQVHWRWKKEIVWTYLLLGTDLFSVS